MLSVNPQGFSKVPDWVAAPLSQHDDRDDTPLRERRLSQIGADIHRRLLSAHICARFVRICVPLSLASRIRTFEKPWYTRKHWPRPGYAALRNGGCLPLESPARATKTPAIIPTMAPSAVASARLRRASGRSGGTAGAAKRTSLVGAVLASCSSAVLFFKVLRDLRARSRLSVAGSRRLSSASHCACSCWISRSS